MPEAHSVSPELLETGSRRWQGRPSLFVTLKTWQGRDPGLPHTGGRHGIKGLLRYSEMLEGFCPCTEDGFTKKQGLP